MAGFIQLKRGATTEELMRHPECFLLLTLIAYRARRTNEGLNSDRLEIGQALIGDYKTIGLSSEKVYRTAKKKLENWNLVAFKGTNKGTVATLLNSDVYDINEDDRGEQKGGQWASKGRTEGEQGADEGRARGGQGATNNNGNNGNNEKNGKNGNNVINEPAPVADLFGEPDPVNGKKNGKKPGAKVLPHLFRNSEFFDVQKIRDAIAGTQYECANVEYYFESLLNWSDSKGEKKANWLATAKNWMLRDMKEGKFVDLNYKPQNRTNGTNVNGYSTGTANDTGRKPIRDVTQQDLITALNQKFGEE